MPAELQLQNSMTGEKQRFEPRYSGSSVKMFTCGPSIYNWPHIGNYRTFLFEDILERYLGHLGYNVNRLINFTDMEDKAIARANELGISLEEITGPVAEKFIQDCKSLKIRLPHTIARSTDTVDQAVYLIERLLDKGLAYRHKGDIFYDPLKFKDFGKLYGLDMSQWPEKKIRFRKDTYPGQRWNLGDFILWKKKRPSDDGIYWETSLGQGRPAWNIQDPAMITKHLGWELDICCGGVDNLYRHHDYNIAIVEGISGNELANFWLHGGYVRIYGKKMSKSRGNIVYLNELLNHGYAPRHIRFFLIYGNYRKPVNLNPDRLHCARGRVDTFRAMVRRIEDQNRHPAGNTAEALELVKRLEPDFENSMNEDLNVKSAFDRLYGSVSRLLDLAMEGRMSAECIKAMQKSLKRIDRVLQVIY
ncbi:MAG: class I tRNA ligase family protein [Desulfobacteraceae bacterium]|nr:class I tRNA ligase family protein [Desulfobacteraceae bacterium]